MNIHLLKKLAATLIAGALTMLAGQAFARSVPASAGTVPRGSNRTNFNVSPTGVTGFGLWQTALHIDAIGTNKFVTTTGGLSPGHELICQVISFRPDGSVIGASSLVVFNPTGTFQTPTVGMPASFITAGARVTINCSMTQGATLVGFNYTP
jgi:hypothetical protein